MMMVGNRFQLKNSLTRSRLEEGDSSRPTKKRKLGDRHLGDEFGKFCRRKKHPEDKDEIMQIAVIRKEK